MYSLLPTHSSDSFNKCMKCNKTIFTNTDEYSDCPKCGSRNPYLVEADYDSPIYRILAKYPSYCKFNCGVFEKMSDLKEHEKVCNKRVRRVLCYIGVCPWRGTNVDLLEHVIENHNEQLIIFSQHRDEGFHINFDDPVKFMLLFDKKYPTNEMFWIKLYETKAQRYLLIHSLGEVRLERNRINMLQIYTVKSVLKPFGMLIDSVIKRVLVEDIMSTSEQMRKEGTDITALEGRKYQIQIYTSDVKNEYLKDKTIMQELQCNNCKLNMSPPIMMCSTGHNICEVCSSEFKHCPICKHRCDVSRNYALEAIANKVETACPFKDFGCKEYVYPLQKHDHVELCLFRTFKCIFDNCVWEGSVVRYMLHFMDSHRSNIIRNGEVDVIRDAGKYPCLMSAFDNLFIVKYKVTMDDIRFAFIHMPLNKVPTFEVELKILNCSDRVVWSSSMTCLREDVSFEDPRFVCIISKELYRVMCNDKYEIRYVVNFFKLLHDSDAGDV